MPLPREVYHSLVCHYLWYRRILCFIYFQADSPTLPQQVESCLHQQSYRVVVADPLKIFSELLSLRHPRQTWTSRHEICLPAQS